jgi:hypothetical protein
MIPSKALAGSLIFSYLGMCTKILQLKICQCVKSGLCLENIFSFVTLLFILMG